MLSGGERVVRRIVIADDHAVVRKGLRLILAGSEDVELAGEAESADELLTLLRTRPVDAVVLDIALADRDGLEVLKHIRSEFPRLPVLMMSIHPEEVFAIRALRAGASGYIEKAAAPQTLLDAVRRVAAGGTYVSAAMADRMVETARGRADVLPHERLSDREFEIFRLLGSGMSVTQIAQALNLSAKTVSTHRMNILSKTSLQTNADIVNYVIANNLR